MSKGYVWMLCEGAVLGGSSLLLLKAKKASILYVEITLG